MRTLRARLIVSYASLLASAVLTAIVVLTVAAVQVVQRPLAAEITAAAQSGRVIAAAADPRTPTIAVEEEIVRRVSRNGLVAFAFPPPGDGFVPLAPPLTAGRRLPLLPPPSPIDVTRFLLPRPAQVSVRDGFVVIAADRRQFGGVVDAYLKTLAVVLVVVLPVAGFIVLWITHQAIDPLTDLTKQLQQLAGGNFTARPLKTSDRTEIGALIAAYNGAAAQVAAAFAERASVEDHMRRFVADAGHELRTPLSVVTGAHEVLRKGGLDEPELRNKIFSTLQVETSRMTALVERLMALARLERPEHPEPEIIYVVELARDVAAAIRASRGGAIDIDGDAGIAVLADRNDLYDALGNLIDNAVKYGEGSRVKVRTTRTTDAVLVSVTDGGPGIPPGDRAHIFDRFYRGWIGRSASGSGLGLAIAHRAVERCGGKLEVQSGEPGRTTFTITLPRPNPALNS